MDRGHFSELEKPILFYGPKVSRGQTGIFPNGIPITWNVWVFTHIPGEGTKAGVIRDPTQPASLILKIIPMGVHFMPALQVGKLRGELGHTDSK